MNWAIAQRRGYEATQDTLRRAADRLAWLAENSDDPGVPVEFFSDAAALMRTAADDLDRAI